MTQSSFRAALLDPALPEPPGLTDPQGRPAGRRFAVYRNNVTLALSEALAASFPALQTLVGEDFFGEMARLYLRAHPPETPVLAQWGAAMPGFLESFPPLADYPYLPDVARLELALRQSYHAADSTPVSPEALALPPDDLMRARLTLAPALRLIPSVWPLHDIWSGAQPGAAAQDVLITRPGYDPEPHPLPPGAAPFLAALMQGETLEQALGTAPEFDLQATLGLLIAGRAITALTLEERP